MSTIGLRRLAYQRIAQPAFHHASEVVAWLGAVQGQDYAGTRWSLGLRLPGSTDLAIEQAIADRSIRRTWAMRGTLHYVAAADLHWLVGLIAPRQIAGNARRYRQLELDEPTLRRSSDLIAAALTGDRQLTRTELLAMLEAHGIATTGQRGIYMLQRAALERRIYQGEVRRNVTTFLALDEGATWPREEAMVELARRYFTSRGPATVHDFAYWSGLPVSEARAGLEGASPRLVREVIEGQIYWRASEAPLAPEHALYLLPGFDEYVLGYRDRHAVLAEQFADAICPGGNGMFRPTIVKHGEIIGTWQRQLKRERVEITIEPFRPIDADEMAALAAAAARFGAFLGLQATLQPTPV